MSEYPLDVVQSLNGALFYYSLKQNITLLFNRIFIFSSPTFLGLDYCETWLETLLSEHMIQLKIVIVQKPVRDAVDLQIAYEHLTWLEPVSND